MIMVTAFTYVYNFCNIAHEICSYISRDCEKAVETGGPSQ